MSKIRICKYEDCQNAATTGGFCRLHYLKNWKKIRDQARWHAIRKLDRYIESVIKHYPDRYMDVIKEDLRSPGFEKRIEKEYGSSNEEESLFDNGPAYDEELDDLLKKFKIEKGF